MASSPSTITETMKRTTHALLTAYSTADVPGVFAVRTEDCVQQLLPKSMGRPPMSNEEYGKVIGGVMKALGSFKMTIHSEIYDPVAMKATVHLTTAGSSPIGDYESEYCFLLEFSNDGEKVKWVGEFVDSAESGEFIPKLFKWMGQQQHGQGGAAPSKA